MLLRHVRLEARGLFPEYVAGALRANSILISYHTDMVGGW